MPRITAEQIRRASEIGGMGLQEAQHWLKHCDGDVLLAVGYAGAVGLAVNIKGGPEARERWNMDRAQRFKDDYLDRYRGMDIAPVASPPGGSCLD